MRLVVLVLVVTGLALLLFVVSCGGVARRDELVADAGMHVPPCRCRMGCTPPEHDAAAIARFNASACEPIDGGTGRR